MKQEQKQKEILANMRGSYALLDYWAIELEDAYNKVEKIKNNLEDHVQTFKQYFPFKEGDILVNGDRFIKFDGLKKVWFKKRGYHDKTKEEILFEFNYSEYLRDGYSHQWFKNKNTMEWGIEDIPKWTIFRNNPVSLLEALTS